MNYIEKYNYELNHDNPSRYVMWKQYREHAIQLMEDNLDKTMQHTLIIGAGKCDDLDLNRIKNLTETLTISDVDLIALNQALDQYGLTEDDVSLKRIEYTGLEKGQFFDQYLNSLLKCKSVLEIHSFLDKQFKTNESFTFLSDEKYKYDLIIVSPIYTQLLFLQILQYSEVLRSMKYPDPFISEIESYVLDIMPRIIDRFNNNVVSLLKRDGKLMVLTDIFEYSVDSEFGRDVEKAILSLMDMDQFYQIYKMKYGLGLGDYGLVSMEGKLAMKAYHWLIWPFDDLKHFIVKLAIFHKGL